jgi:hypothetical protein
MAQAKKTQSSSMNMNSHDTLQSIPALCRGSRQLLHDWLYNKPTRSLSFCIPMIILGCGVYGFTMGIWQGWLMAAYVAIKFPLVIFATLILNGLINGMLAMALGSGINFRQSFQFLLAGFALMSLILLSLSPIALFIVYHAPDPTASNASQSHSIILLSHTLMIAYAGIISHRSLLGQVRDFATSPAHGNRTFFAWLVGNLFVGAQVSWIMRPFFGTPGLEVQFLRNYPMNGSFYDTIWNSFSNIFLF